MTDFFPGMKDAKRALRQEILARRNALPAADNAALSARVVANALSLPVLEEAEVVLLFASFGSEVRTAGLIAQCLANGQDVVLPRVRREDRRLDLYRIESPERDLEPGTWGIPEPVPGRCVEVMPRDLDFIFAPGVAFDLHGNRLGYGGGFYDRLLAQVRRELLHEGLAALGFELQLVDTVPHKPKDVPVPLIVTESRVIATERGN